MTKRSRDPFYDQIERNIRGPHKQSVLAVTSEGETPAFAYTVGNHGAGWSELILIGVDPTKAVLLLNEYARIRRNRKRPFEHGELVFLEGGRWPVKIVDCLPSGKVHQDWTIQVSRYYRCDPSEIHVQQVILSDPNGKFPGQAGCDPRFARQIFV